VIALRDPASRLPVAALKRWEVPGGGLEARLFLPDRVVSYTAQAGSTVSGWRRTNTVDNLLGVVPVVEFCNRPTITGEGTSELADVAPLQDAVNKLCTDMLVASEFNSFKARYLMLDKDAGREAIDRMVAELKHKAAAFQRYLVTTARDRRGRVHREHAGGVRGRHHLADPARGHHDPDPAPLLLPAWRVPVRGVDPVGRGRPGRQGRGQAGRIR